MIDYVNLNNFKRTISVQRLITRTLNSAEILFLEFLLWWIGNVLGWEGSGSVILILHDIHGRVWTSNKSTHTDTHVGVVLCTLCHKMDEGLSVHVHLNQMRHAYPPPQCKIQIIVTSHLHRDMSWADFTIKNVQQIYCITVQYISYKWWEVSRRVQRTFEDYFFQQILNHLDSTMISVEIRLPGRWKFCISTIFVLPTW